MATRRKARPDVSRLGYPPSRLWPLAPMHYFRLCLTTHTVLYFVRYRTTWRTSPKLRNSIVWSEPELNSVDKAHKIGCHGNVPRGIEKLTSGRSFTAIVLPHLKIWRRLVRGKR